MKTLNMIFAILLFLSLAGCGGGGSDVTTLVTPATPAINTKAIIKLNITGTLPQNRAIAGAGFTLTLPADVTPEIVNNTLASSVISTSGTFTGGTQTPPVYTAATGTTPGKIEFAAVNAAQSGVTQVGEFATVTLQLANGAAPTTGSFSVSGVTVVDTGGNVIDGMSVEVGVVTLQ